MKRVVLIVIFVLCAASMIYDVVREKISDPAAETTAAAMVPPEPQPVYVYVSGAVAKPGLYSFPNALRVGEVVAAAGNVTAYADTGSINMAEMAEDGQHIHIAYDWNGVPAAPAEEDGLISINQADEKKLTELPGIGPSMAKRIAEYRQEHGPFAAVEDLQKVKGIGASKFADLKDKVKV